MKSVEKKLVLAGVACLALAGMVVYSTTSFDANYDAFAEQVKRLDERLKDRVAKLVAVETSGWTRNEEKGLAYYGAHEGTRETNRIYLAWCLLPAGEAPSHLREAIAGRSQATARDQFGVAIFVEPGFDTFRTRYGMSLAQIMKDRGLEWASGVCYRWEDKVTTWVPAGELPRGVAGSLLTPEQKKAIMSGSYNLVSVATAEGPR